MATLKMNLNCFSTLNRFPWMFQVSLLSPHLWIHSGCCYGTYVTTLESSHPFENSWPIFAVVKQVSYLYENNLFSWNNMCYYMLECL